MCRRADGNDDDVVAGERDVDRPDEHAASRPGVLLTERHVLGGDAVLQHLPRSDDRLCRRRTGRQRVQRSRLLVAADALLLVKRLPADARHLRQLLSHRVQPTVHYT